jgi:inner membrane protein
MDNITHTLFGAVLAQSGLKRATRFGSGALLVGANLPDLDGFSYFFSSPGGALAFRRGWTHGILAMVVWPFVLAGILWGLSRLSRTREPVRPRALLLLAAIGVWSHPLLDLLNVYGVRLLMPFSEHWFKADALYIIDPWVWGLLLGALLLGAMAKTHRPARWALGAFAGYAVLMAIAGKVGRDLVARRTGVAARTMAAPVFANPFRRTVLRDLGNEYESGELFFGLRSKYLPTGRIPTGRDQPGVAEAAGSSRAQWFLRWARFPVFESETAGDAWRVRINDIRFGRIRGMTWASVTLEVPRRAGGGS